ncbi:MAG: hypothetical protein PWP27_804 [Clostridiales bacterium]|jgi:NAD(P)H-nitrite reductase large subunit|nr:hypothetical protein [Clostridiales bacterium]MDK2932994.1 hypothetical protein [Clostridiales bacterium]
MKEDYVVCRCEEITLQEIKSAIKQGAITLDEIKKYTRAGMGLCQGRICSTIIIEILKEHGYLPQYSAPPHSRIPVRPVKIWEYIGEDQDV